MPNPRQALGKRGEVEAARLLKKNGYRILHQNYRTPVGEIDIIAREKKTIVFIEVKARSSTGYGHPKLAVTALKQRRISMAALCYLKETGQIRAKARFDVVSVLASDPVPQIEIVRNAFELAYP